MIATAERVAPSFAPLIVLLAYTGMRIREALGLRWQDVDLDDGDDPAALAARAGRPQPYVPVKTDAGDPRPSDPARAAAPADRAPARLAVDAPGRSRCSPRRAGSRRRTATSAGRSRRSATSSGVDLVSHDFRRSLASFLIVAARADEAAVTAVMGHANIETTRRIYAGDWREAEERNALVLRQLAEAGIGQ